MAFPRADGTVEFNRLRRNVPDLDADMLAARQLYTIAKTLGHEPTLDECKCVMLGASYVIEVAQMVLGPANVAVVRKAAEAAMAVSSYNVEEKARG